MHTAAGAATILFGLFFLQCAPVFGAALETFSSVAVSTGNDRVTLCDAGAGLSAVQAADACVCGPGFGGADDASCTACGLGTHKKNSEFVGCTNCGLNRLTLAGARDSAECVCAEGFEESSGSCAGCAAGFYKAHVGNEACLQCFAHGTSAAGSTAVSACECVAGYTAAASASTFDGTCEACGTGHFKISSGMEACPQCRANSETSGAATSASECLCVAGYYDEGGVCTVCPKGHYKTSAGDQTCTKCTGFDAGLETTVGTGNVLEDACVCAIGAGLSVGTYSVSLSTSDMSGGSSITLAKGAYNVISSPKSPVNHPFRVSTHASWSTSYDYENMVIEASTATENIVTVYIPADYTDALYYYCERHTTMHGALILDSSLSSSTCTQCGVHTAQNTEADVACADCSSTQYAAVGSSVCSVCPGNSLRVGTTGVIGDCYCTAGYYEASNECNQCEAGTFKTSTANEACEDCAAGTYEDQTGSTACELCHGFSDSVKASTSETDCKCIAGYHPNAGACVACLDGYVKAEAGNTQCVACGAGSYSSDAQTCHGCQGNSNTESEASTSIADCKCVAGYQENADDADVCESCSAGYYCPGQDNREQCHAESTSEAGSSAASACVCDAGYWAPSSGHCANCPQGSFCFGDEKYACPSPGTSPANSHSEDACTCNSGYQSIPAAV